MAGAEQRQTKQARKRPVCASLYRQCTLSRDSTARPAQISGVLTRGFGRRLILRRAESIAASRRLAKLGVHSQRLADGTTQPLRICAVHFRHWPSALHWLLPKPAVRRFATRDRSVRARVTSRCGCFARRRALSRHVPRFTCSLQLHCFWTFSCRFR